MVSNPSNLKYLGIKTGISHSNACLIDVSNKKSFVRIEERLTRIKYKGGFPSLSLKSLFDLDKTIINLPGKNIATNSCTSHPRYFEKKIPSLGNLLPQVSCLGNEEMLYPSHHYCHMLSGLATSGWEEGYVLVCDGVGSRFEDLSDSKKFGKCGENETLSLYRFQGEKIELIYRECSTHKVILKHDKEYPLNNGIGSLYMNAANAIFGQWQASGKVMGLSAYGKTSSEFGHMNNLELNHYLMGDQFANHTSLNRVTSKEFNRYANIAFEVQKRFEEYLFNILKTWVPRGSNLVFVGGSALNCTLNGKIRDYALYTPSNPCDFGIGMGAAIYSAMKNHSIDEIRSCFSDYPFLGGSSHKSKLQQSSLGTAQKLDIKNLIEKLCEGEILALVEGRSEIGARALGHRSLLAAPHLGYIKDKLNLKIKKREDFRPYGVCILEDRVQDYFECSKNYQAPYMDRALKIKPSHKHILKDIVHRDGTTRIQTLKRDDSIISRLLQVMEQESGFPIMINTSLNKMGDPICETSADAKELLESDCLNYAIIDGKLHIKDPEKVFHRMNLDYELELFSDEINQKISESFGLEYLYFFYPHKANEFLVTKLKYSEEYRNRISDLGINIKTAQNKESTNWFGDLENLHEEKEFNSKIWMLKFLKEIGLERVDSYIANGIDEYHLIKQKISASVFTKSPYLMSGTSCQIDEIPRDGDFPLIVEAFHNRAIDFSSFVHVSSGKQYFYENLVDENGGYLGGRMYENQNDFFQYFSEIYPMEELESAHYKLALELKRRGAKRNYSIDSYFTKTGEFIPCCDINYRHSMGEFLYHCRRFLPKGGIGEFIISNEIEGNFSYSKVNKQGIINLAPKDSKTKSILICAGTREQLNRIKKLL